MALPQEHDGQVLARMHACMGLDLHPAILPSLLILAQFVCAVPPAPELPLGARGIACLTATWDVRRSLASPPCCGPSQASTSARQRRMWLHSTSPELRSWSRSDSNMVVQR